MENIIKLLSPSENVALESAAIKSVFLEDVNLSSGVWSTVFQHLYSCPVLQWFSPLNLSYTNWSNFNSIPKVRRGHNILSLHPADEKSWFVSERV